MDERAFAESASLPKSQLLDSQGKQRLDNEYKMSNDLEGDSHESGYESTGAAKKGSWAPEAWCQNEDNEVFGFIGSELLSVVSPQIIEPDLEHTNTGTYLMWPSRDSGYSSLETSPGVAWAEVRNDSLTEKNSWMEKIMCSLEDDGPSVEINSSMKRGDSNQHIPEWVSLWSDTQTSAVVEACSQADPRDGQEIANALMSLQRGTQLDENIGTPTRVGYTNVRILSDSSHS